MLIRSLPMEVFNTSLGWDRNLLEELPALFENLGQRISKVSSDSRFCAPAIPIYSLVVSVYKETLLKFCVFLLMPSSVPQPTEAKQIKQKTHYTF